MRRPPRYTALPAELTAATTAPEEVSVPARAAIAIDGAGSPDAPAFAAAVSALYAVGYALRVARAKAERPSFVIGPLESRWAAAGEPEVGDGDATRPPPPATWRWRLRLAVPSDVGDAEIAAAKASIAQRHPDAPSVGAVFHEQLPAQRLGRILHVGPYADERTTLARLDAALSAAGHHAAPSHLEVFLNDPRRTSPARLRTALLRELA